MRKVSLAAPVGLVAILLLSSALVAHLQETSILAATPILGLTAAHAAAEHKVEAEFRAIPSPERAREWHRKFTAEPTPPP